MRTTLPLFLLAGLPLNALAQPAWTVLSPTENVYYVSSSAGDDGNPGTLGAPVRTLARGYTLLRDGHADWLLLKAGDTWSESFPSTWAKASGSASSYMVIGRYGTGARPKLRVSSPAIYGGTAAKTGLAITDLDVMPTSPGSGYAGFTFFANASGGWSHLLIEGCSVVGFPVDIVCQEIGSGRLNDVRVRFCVIADSTETGSSHSQGIFAGSVDGLVIEACVIDNNGQLQSDMFSHNGYLHETCGWSTFSYNITARASSHGVQQRSGGYMIGNLALDNPINLYQGNAAGFANQCRDNVVLGSRNINAVDTRGQGYVLAGHALIENNVAAHQVMGSDAVTAFDFDGIQGGTVVRGNVVWRWDAPASQGWATAFQWDSGSAPVLFENNAAWMPNHGMCIRHEGFVLSSGFTYRNNRYWSTNPATGYEQFSSSGGLGGNWDWWRARAGESGSTFANPGTFNVRISDYMASIGLSGGVAEFMTEARKLSRDNYRPQYTAMGVNPWVRGQLGMGPAPCYADMNGDGALNILDFTTFLNAYAVGDAVVNCDGSTTAPILNANDFQCFLNSYASGCH